MTYLLLYFFGIINELCTQREKLNSCWHVGYAFDSFGDRSFEYQVSKMFLLCIVFRRIHVVAKSAWCLSVGICLRGSHWTDLSEIWYWGVPRKSVEKKQIWLKSGKNIRHFTWRTQERFIVPGDINSFQKHCCTSLIIFILLTVACISIVCRERSVASPLRQWLRARCLSCSLCSSECCDKGLKENAKIM